MPVQDTAAEGNADARRKRPDADLDGVDAASEDGGGPYAAHPLLRMQATFGNAYVQRFVADQIERDNRASTAPADPTTTAPADTGSNGAPGPAPTADSSSNGAASTAATAAPSAPPPQADVDPAPPGPIAPLPPPNLPTLPAAAPPAPPAPQASPIAGAATAAVDAMASAGAASAAAAPPTPAAPAAGAAAAPPATPRGDVVQAAFAEPDVSTILPPPSPDDDPDARRRMADDLRAKLAEDRARGQQAVDEFVAQRRSMTDQLAAARPDLEAQVAAAETVAVDSIDAETQTQVAAVQAAVATALAAAQAQSAQACDQIEAAYVANTDQIRATTSQVRDALQQASQPATDRAAAAEAGQLSRLEALYTQIESDFHAAAAAAGDLAVTNAAQRASTYRAGKINEDDSFLDGPLTDNRCEAQAEAAEKVGAAYKDELTKEGDKQAAKMRERQPTDTSAVQEVTSQTRQSLASLLEQAIKALEDSERASLANAQAAHDQLLAQVDDTLRTTSDGLAQHEATQVAQLQAQASQRKQAVHDAAAEVVTGLGQAIDTAVQDVDSALSTLVTQLNAGQLPDIDQLQATLAEAGGQLDAQLSTLQQGVQTQATQSISSLTDASTQSVQALTDAGTAAVDAATTTGSAAVDAFTTIVGDGTTALQNIAKGHQDAGQLSNDGFGSGSTTILDGQTQTYDRFNDNLTQGAQRNVQSVRDGLTQAVEKDMPATIDQEAAKAYDQVLPRWKSVLKWVIIIAIVLVVAIVIGPLVIGAAAGAATALGASAVVGTVIGGALVGAATSAVVTMVDNAFAGRDLTTGIGTAIIMGAIGGGIGGAAAGLLSGPMQGMSAIARFGVQVGVDMAIDTGMNLFTGNLSWENFGKSLALSMLVNGVAVNPHVAAFSEGLSSRGFGAGYDAGANVRANITGDGLPGSLGAVGIDAQHVNLGDSTGANSPYGGRWNMRGGGHNANEFPARIAAEGGGPTDYRRTTAVEDPVTGVSIDQITRNQMGGNAANPQTVLDPVTGQPVQQSALKSLFPPSMDRASIQAAGQRALELASGGAPGTTYTTPPGPNQNGSFSAIVTTPDGHPIRVQGFYSLDAAGQPVIRTVYPATDIQGPTPSIPPVPGSRTNVPGAATPPTYTRDDDEN